MDRIENKTFEEISVGDHCLNKHTVTEQDITLFAITSGDRNPIHLDAEYAASTPFKTPIAHGMYTGALISSSLAMELPGPGTIYLGQSIAFHKPVRAGDELSIKLTVKDKHDSKPIVFITCEVSNQDGLLVASGEAKVMAPTEKIRVSPAQLPEVTLA